MITVLRLTLGVVFVSAAASKALGWHAFERYLRTPLGGLATLAALVTIVAEMSVGLLSALPSARQIWPWIAASLIGTLTAFYSVRLSFTEDVSCACWGRSTETKELSAGRRALGPMTVGIRNAALVFSVGLVSSTRHGHLTLEMSMLAIAALCPVVVGAGLLVSIIRVRRDGGRSWNVTYSTRWQYVRSCTRLPNDVDMDPVDDRHLIPLIAATD